jgi:hypothetical protein
LSVQCEKLEAMQLTAWWTRLPFKVCIARSAAPGSSYSTNP